MRTSSDEKNMDNQYTRFFPFKKNFNKTRFIGKLQNEDIN